MENCVTLQDKLAGESRGKMKGLTDGEGLMAWQKGIHMVFRCNGIHLKREDGPGNEPRSPKESNRHSFEVGRVELINRVT